MLRIEGEPQVYLKVAAHGVSSHLHRLLRSSFECSSYSAQSDRKVSPSCRLPALLMLPSLPPSCGDEVE